jgi:hypothetical protein
MREASPFPQEGTPMKASHASGRNLLVFGGRLLGHSLAVIVGFALMIVGVGMGVTMVLLPVGIPVGLLGLLLFVWGLYARSPRGPA